MLHQLSWKVGGQQGEGIESTGEIFCNGNEPFRISSYTVIVISLLVLKVAIRIIKLQYVQTEVRSIADDLDILVAFDQETIDVNYKELTESSIILADAKFNPAKPEDC